MAALEKLIEKLETARFSGRLDLRFEAGEIVAGELHHFLAFEEFQSKALPTIEPEKFTLKP